MTSPSSPEKPPHAEEPRSGALRIDLLTLFPAMTEGFFKESILGRAADKGILDIRTHNLRDWAKNKHRRVDDTPFGGGAGMLMAPQPLFDAIEELRTPGARVVYLCPDGRPLTNAIARGLAGASHLVFVSGHYEGVDQRVRDALITDEISIGDYVLTNGTLAAAVGHYRPVAWRDRFPACWATIYPIAGRGKFWRERRAAESSAVHAPGGLSRHEGAGGASRRKPQGHFRLEQGSARGEDPRTPARTVDEIEAYRGTRARHQGDQKAIAGFAMGRKNPLPARCL